MIGRLLARYSYNFVVATPFSFAIRLAILEVQRPFKLSEGSLVRGYLIRLKRSEHIILFNMHHIVSDGWSIGVFMREFVAIYEAFYRGEDSPLEGISIQYADFALWQRKQLHGKKLESHISYWKEKLDGDLPILELPTDRPHPSIQTYNGTIYHFECSKDLSQKLYTLSKSNDLNAQSVHLVLSIISGISPLLLN